MYKTWLGRSVHLQFGFLNFVRSRGTGRSFENPATFHTQTLAVSFLRKRLDLDDNFKTLLNTCDKFGSGDSWFDNSYLTNWIIIIPILFGLGIPLVNIDKPLKYKAGLTLVIVIASLAVFVIAIMTAVSFNFDKYIFPGLVVGTSGVLLLGINGLLIESVKVNTKTVLVTFLLSGLSLPTWIILTESILPTTIRDNDVVRQFGVMLFWMTLTTIGITIGIENKKPTANKVHNQWRGSV